MNKEELKEYERKSYGMENIHKMLLVAMDRLDKICKKNNIKYSLHGGCLLGAERNHKLIPWDDDIDISVTRKEYDKLIPILKKEHGKFYFDDTTTWVPRFAYSNEKEGVFISIFVWDYISENLLEQKLKLLLLRVLQGMLKRNIDYGSYSSKNKVLIFGTHIMGLLFPYQLKKKWQNDVGKDWFQGRQKYIHRSNDAYKGVGFIFKEDYMGSYSEIELEGRMYMVTSRYKEFLKMNYGPDYMTPPPIEQRKPEHFLSREQVKRRRKAGGFC